MNPTGERARKRGRRVFGFSVVVAAALTLAVLAITRPRPGRSPRHARAAAPPQAAPPSDAVAHAAPPHAAPARGAAALPDAAAPPAGAYATGGVPGPADPVARRAFAVLLPRFVTALDRAGARPGSRGRAALASARHRLLSPPVAGALPVRALAAVLDRAVAAARAPRGAAGAAAARLSRAVRALDDALAHAGVPFFVDSDVAAAGGGRRVVLLSSFAVVRVVLYRSGAELVRSLRVRRLDHLSFGYRLLGFSAPDRRDAVVLLDRIDARLAGVLLPAAGGAADALLAPATGGARWYRRFCDRAAALIRRELAAAVGRGAGGVGALADLFARRRAVIERTNRHLAARGVALRQPSGRRLGWNLARAARLMAPADLRRLRAIERALAAPAAVAAFRRARRLLVRSIEAHEVRHRLDFRLATPARFPARLRRYLATACAARGPAPGTLTTGAAAELSAYLAELAETPDTSGIELTLVASFALEDSYAGSPERCAALAMFSQLARATHVAHRPLRAPGTGRVDRAQVVALYRALSARSAAALAGAARASWQRLFDRRLLPLVRMPPPASGARAEPGR